MYVCVSMLVCVCILVFIYCITIYILEKSYFYARLLEILHFNVLPSVTYNSAKLLTI